MSFAIQGDTLRSRKRAGATPLRPDCSDKFAFGVELLQPKIARVGHIDRSVIADRQVCGVKKLPWLRTSITESLNDLTRGFVQYVNPVIHDVGDIQQVSCNCHVDRSELPRLTDRSQKVIISIEH